MPDILNTSATDVFESRYALPFIKGNVPIKRFFRNEEIKDSPIFEMMQNILFEYQNKPFAYEIAIKSYIYTIFLYIYRNFNNDLNINKPAVINNEKIELLNKAFSYIYENYKFDITAQDAAKSCNLSYSLFSRLFKITTGKTFSEYLTSLRLSEAEKLLISTDLSISEIASEAGYTYVNYFIKQFKEQKKMSPKKYRDTYRSNLPSDFVIANTSGKQIKPDMQ